MLLSDHSWKTNLELIMEVRSLWADVNLRMPILLHVTICISWIEGLHNKCISLCIMISNRVVKPTVNLKFKSQILWKSSTELKINIPYWNLHDYLWAESGSLKHCKIDEPCCQLHLPKQGRFYWHALNSKIHYRPQKKMLEEKFTWMRKPEAFLLKNGVYLKWRFPNIKIILPKLHSNKKVALLIEIDCLRICIQTV